LANDSSATWLYVYIIEWNTTVNKLLDTMWTDVSKTCSVHIITFA